MRKILLGFILLIFLTGMECNTVDDLPTQAFWDGYIQIKDNPGFVATVLYDVENCTPKTSVEFCSLDNNATPNCESRVIGPDGILVIDRPDMIQVSIAVTTGDCFVNSSGTSPNIAWCGTLSCSPLFVLIDSFDWPFSRGYPFVYLGG